MRLDLKNRPLRPGHALAALLLCLFCALAFEAWYIGPTVDEPSHLLSSYLWWHGRDRLYPRDMPPLIKIVGGFPAALRGLPVPADLGLTGDTRSEWNEAAGLFGRIPPGDLQTVLFWSRLPLTVFPILTAWLLFIWGRRLFGEWPALGVAAMWSLCPTVLGHGALLKNDVAATFAYLLFWYAAWRCWLDEDDGWRPALLAAAAAALGVLAKLSLLFLPALAVLLVVARSVRRRRPMAGILQALAALGLMWLITAAAWQFDLHRTTSEEMARLAADSDVPGWFMLAARVCQWLPVPTAAWTGVLSLTKSNASPAPVYMLGQIFPEGHRLYFLLATVLKMSFPALLLCAAGFIRLPLPGIRRRWSDCFWLTPGLLYFAMASMSSLHLGVRLVLPAWAFFFLTAGAGLAWASQTLRGRAVVAAGFLIMLALTAAAYPWGIAFLNPYVGGPVQSLRYLSDSNVDWGQSLGAAVRYASSHGIRPLHLAYFGFDNRDRYCAPGQCVSVPVPWGQNSAVTRYQPEPGWYAVSANFLPGHYFHPKYRDYFAEFRRRQPVAVAGGSIFIYRIDPN